MSKQRTITSLLLVPIAVAAVLLLPTPYLAAFIALISLLGLWEWARLAGIDNATPRSLYVAANLALMAALAWGGWPVLFRVVAFIGAGWWLLALIWLARPDFGREARRWTRSLKLAAGTICILPAWCAMVLLHFGTPHADPHGPRWALFALVLVWATDSGAYFIGRRFGKRKLIPAISPGKTWAGLWGGVAGGVAITLAASSLLGVGSVQLPLLAALGLLGVIASVVGDLFESLMKRHAGMKDSGTLIPGHGGMLDRLDSVLAALPVIAIGKEWLGL